MAILSIRVPEVKDVTDGRPAGCAACGAATLQSWGTVQKPIRDTTGSRTIQVRRYRCTACSRTFRHYPSGVTSAEQTGRLQVAAAMMWAMGLSLRSATAFLSLFGAGICHQTVWRDGVALGKQLGQRRPHGPVRVLGVDGTGARIAGQSSGVVVAVDMGTGAPVAFIELDERDPEAACTGRCRSRFPAHADQRFRSMSITDSGPWRPEMAGRPENVIDMARNLAE